MEHRRSHAARLPTWRRIAIVLPVIVTVLAVASVGIALIAEQQRRADISTEADRIAQDYIEQVHAFRSTMDDLITAGRDSSPSELRTEISAHLALVPQLPQVTGQGAEISRDYRDAQYLQSSLSQPYVELIDALEGIAIARDFIAAATEALEVNIVDLAGATTITDPAVVTDQVLPALEARLADFRSVPVPAQAEDVAGLVESALQYVIDQSTLMASLADLGQNYSFDYGTQVAAASEAVRLYTLTVDSQQAAAIDTALTD